MPHAARQIGHEFADSHAIEIGQCDMGTPFGQHLRGCKTYPVACTTATVSSCLSTSRHPTHTRAQHAQCLSHPFVLLRMCVTTDLAC
ncbi:hypothetical protein P3T25_005532 [Paraburkholderia sp. GAS32]